MRRATLLSIAHLTVCLMTNPIRGETLFEDTFDTSPCGRWAIYYGDCSTDAGCTVYHYTSAQDACGGTWGYVYREYDGDRCMVNTSLSTEGYTNLKLRFWYRITSGGSISVAVKRNGSWTAELAEVGLASAWTMKEIDLSGVVTGVRFKLKGASGDTRRLDCVSIQGDPECTPAVEIIQHPTDDRLCAGGTAVFLVSAGGSNLTYQWQKDGADLSDGGDVSGATTATLTIANAEAADSGAYRCVVTGDCGTAASNPAALTVSAQPTITQHPAAQEVDVGETAAFTVAASGVGALGYQWQKDGADLSDGGRISGAATAQLQVAGVNDDDAGHYRCVVTDDCGTATSDAAALTVSHEATLFEDNFDVNPCTTWSIYYDDWSDAGCTVYYETSYQDACGTSQGYAYRSYDGNRWMVSPTFTTAGYDDLVLTFYYKIDSGAGIEAWAKQDGTWVHATTVGAAGSWTKAEAALSGTVTRIRFHLVGGNDEARRLDCISIVGEPECTPPVVITQQPTATGACPGDTVQFSVSATGSSLTYQWQKDGADLADGGDISGTTTHTLQIAGAEEADSGDYGCVVTGDCGTVISDAAALLVSAVPTITQHPASQEECVGNTATFSVIVIGAGTITYQWQKDGADLIDGEDVSGTAASTLTIANVEHADAGDYRCIVTDDCGTVLSSEAALTVSDACMGLSPSGHYLTYKGQALLLAGDSGTQCATQNSNLDHRAWIDDCAARGLRSIHVWSFMAARQKQDGSVVEDRWGYVYPCVTPWARHTSGPLANDQLHRWNLQSYDDGPDGDLTHYWPRMRDMCTYAKSKDILVGYTVFTGWIKGNHDAWEYHPFNVENGGHLTDNLPDGVTIASPGTEVWQEAWNAGWSNAKKTQWVWERLAIKAINDLGQFKNVFFVFFDEHSYDEGNMGDHFRDFFRSRGQMWMDWSNRRSSVDLVMSSTFGGDDKNADAVSGFNGLPTKPYFFLEGEPYMGDGVRTAIWTFMTGGGSYFFHADAGQETDRTGIMGYDPYVPGGDKGMAKRDWLGHASRLFNESVVALDGMAPHNALSDSGTYCLAEPGREYVVYSKIGSSTTFNVNLTAAAGKTLDCRFYNPRNGNVRTPFQRAGGGVESFTKPNADDWALHIVVPMVSLTVTETNGEWGDVETQPEPTDPPAMQFPKGTPVTLTAVPIEGKTFGQWEIYDPNYPGDVNHATIDSNMVATIVMDTDLHVNAVWKCGTGAGPLLPVILLLAGIYRLVSWGSQRRGR